MVEAEVKPQQQAGADGNPDVRSSRCGGIVAPGAFVAAGERDGEQRPFGYYWITQRSDERAIGGVGFKGGARERSR